MAIKGFFNCMHCGGVSAGKKCCWCVNGVSKEEKRKWWEKDLKIINKELENERLDNDSRASGRD